MSKTSTLFFLFDNRDLETGFFVGRDVNFNDYFDEFTDIIALLGKRKFEPKNETIEKIFEYAKQH